MAAPIQLQRTPYAVPIIPGEQIPETLLVCWHLIQSDNLNEDHVIKINAIDTVGKIFWGREIWEQSKQHKSVYQQRRNNNGEITMRRVYQEFGLAELNGTIALFKNHMHSVDLAQILQGDEKLIRDLQAWSATKTTKTSLTNADTVPEAVVDDLVRAYRLLKLAGHVSIPKAYMIAMFCRLVLPSGSWEAKLKHFETNESALDLVGSKEIGDIEKNGAGMESLLRTTAIELVKGVRRSLEKKFPVHAGALDWVLLETE